MRKHATLVVLILALGAVVFSSGCLSNEPYEACNLPPELSEKCVSPDKDTPISSVCKVEHPGCLEGYCVTYRGSQGFCTGECASDSECEGGRCVALALECETKDPNSCLHVCIQDSVLE